MPRVHHVKRAAKDYPNHGIQKGEPYYWWKFRYGGGKRRSKTPPKRSQLTQSPFLGQLYDLQDEVEARLRGVAQEDGDSFDGGAVESELQDIAGDLESLRDECQESLDNMPDELRDSSQSGELLQERVDQLEEASRELEDLARRANDEGADLDELCDCAADALGDIG